MAKQIIDLGSSANKGDGDPLRTAFRKINENFTELYAVNGDADGAVTNVLPDSDATRDLGSADKQWADLYVSDFIYLGGARLEVDGNNNLRLNNTVIAADTQGSVFADDSTLLVDAVNGVIPTTVLSGTITNNITGSVTPSTFKPPMLTQAQIDALTPALGMMVYNTTTGKFQGYAADANNDSTTGWADLH